MELNTLLIVAEAVGTFLIVAMVCLLWKGRVYLDAKGDPVTFEIPVFGKIKTQSPVIAMVLIGTGLVLFSITKAPTSTCPKPPRQVTLLTPIDTAGNTVNVYLAAKDQVAESKNTYPIMLTIGPDVAEFTALYEVDRHIYGTEPVTIPVGASSVTLQGFDYSVTNQTQAAALLASNAVQPAQVKEVSDDEIKKLNIK